MVTRVNGGVINDQMLKGKLRFFKIVGPANAFQYTIGTDSVGDGTGIPNVVVPNTNTAINDANTALYVEKVGIKQPSPNSVAEYVISAILEKCTVSMIKIVSDTEIHVAIENTSNGWDTTSSGEYDFDTGLDIDSDAAANMLAVIKDGGTLTNVPDITNTGKSFDTATLVSVTEVPFVLV